MASPEDLFRNKFDGFERKPSDKVWQKIQRRLYWQKFLKFNPKTFNIYYLAATLGTAALIGVSAPEHQDLLVEGVTSAHHVYSGSTRKILIDNGNQSVLQSPSADFHDDMIDNSDSSNLNIKKSTSSDLQSKTSVTAHNQDNIQSTKTHEIVIPDFTSKFKMSASSGCAPFTVTFKNLSKNIDYCYWNFGDGEVSYDQDVKKTYYNEGTYYVTLKTVNGTFAQVFSDTVTVYAQPHAEIAIVTSMQTAIAEARNTKASTFVWDFGDGKKSVGQKVSHLYSDYGQYLLKLIISNNICYDTIATELAISAPEYSLKFPNALIPSVSGPNDGTFTIERGHPTVFIPKGDISMISRYSIKILNRNGKEVFQSNDVNYGWNGYYRNELLPQGVYVYRAQYEFINGECANITGNITLRWEE